MLDTYLSVLEQGYDEARLAFEGLSDENVWKRPSEGLLSVGELAGHIAYWEAIMLAGEGGEPEPDLTMCRIHSPLIDHRFAYYTPTPTAHPSTNQLAMTAQQVCDELFRVHEEAVADFKQRDPDLDALAPGWSTTHTFGRLLKYTVFHVGYHAGQMYSVRHLLGETTPDN